MRRIFLSLWLCLTIVVHALWAGPVDRKRASQVAAGYIRVNLQEEALRSAEQSSRGIAPAYHIFNDEDRNGFVIISGEEGFAPVVAYADEGVVALNNLPEQLSELLRRYEQRVRAVRLTSSGLPGQSTTELLHRPRVLVGPLVTCTWNQSTPYNDKAPKKTGEGRAPTGCVATALAQVMYFHQWPAKGQGSHRYNNSHYGELSADFSKSVYDWASMKDTYTRNSFGAASWTTKEAAAVALLMYDLGVSVNMQYAPDESGAFTSDAVRALGEYFDYHVRYFSRDAMNNEEFVSGVKNELDAGYPIIMMGASEAGGHAWVVDGYDENGYLHVNWGWGGSSNGYFELDFMNPPILGIGGSAGRFNQGQELVLIRPRKEGATLPEDLKGRHSLLGDGMTIDDKLSNLKTGYLTFSIPELGNMLKPKFKGEFGVGLYQPDGTLVEAFASYPLGEIPRLSYFVSPQTVRVDLMANHQNLSGRYYFAPISREQRLKSPTANPDKEDSWEVAGDWVRMAHSNVIYVRLSGGQVELISETNEPAFVLTKAPEELTKAWTKRKGSIRAAIKNESFLTIRGNVALVFSRQGQPTSKPDTLDLDETVFYDYATVDRPLIYSTLTGGSKLEVGKYRVSFCVIKPEEKYTDDAGKVHTEPREVYSVENPFGDFEIEILDSERKPVVEYYTSSSVLHALEFFHDGSVHRSDMIRLSETKKGVWEIGTSLRNYGESIESPVRYRLMDMATGELIELATSASVRIRNSILSNGQTKATIDFSKLNLEVGHRYRILTEVRVDGEWVDVWNADRPRRYLFVGQDKSESTDPANGGGGQGNTAAVDIVDRQPARVYPNPVSDRLFVSGEDIAMVELFNIEGVRILVLNDNLAEGIDMSQYSAGVYVVKTRTSGGLVDVQRVLVR